MLELKPEEAAEIREVRSKLPLYKVDKDATKKATKERKRESEKLSGSKGTE